MKTTLELPDPLFAEARRFADARDMTMKALVEQALRKIMTEPKEEPTFTLRDGSFNGGKDGNGMTPEYQNASWEEKLAMIYEGRA